MKIKMYIGYLLFWCLTPCCLMSKEADLASLSAILDNYLNQPAAKANLGWTAEVNKWAKDIDTSNLTSEWRRLNGEVKEKIKNGGEGSSNLPTLNIVLRTLFFEISSQKGELKLVTELLKDGEIGLCDPLIQPEFYLVKLRGVDSFKSFFLAFEATKSETMKHWLSLIIKKSFGKLRGQVWLAEEDNTTTVSKLKTWYEANAFRLRCVEVYSPMGSREIFFEQGLQEDEFLVGLFFCKK